MKFEENVLMLLVREEEESEASLVDVFKVSEKLCIDGGGEVEVEEEEEDLGDEQADDVLKADVELVSDKNELVESEEEEVSEDGVWEADESVETEEEMEDGKCICKGKLLPVEFKGSCEFDREEEVVGVANDFEASSELEEGAVDVFAKDDGE